jgi:Protein of unknown function (DUF1360)
VTAVILLSLAAFRITRFILEDSLIEEPRDWLKRRVQGKVADQRSLALWRRKVLELLECPWCMSVWISAGTVVLASFTWNAPRPPLFWEWLFVCGGSIIAYLVAEKLAG